MFKLAMKQVFVMHMYRSDTGGPGGGARQTGVGDHTASLARRRGAARERRVAVLGRGTVKEGPQPDCVFCPV